VDIRLSLDVMCLQLPGTRKIAVELLRQRIRPPTGFSRFWAPAARMIWFTSTLRKCVLT